MSKIRNIIIFVIIAGIFASIYFFYIRKSPDDSPAKTSSLQTEPGLREPAVKTDNSSITQDFLKLLLSVKNIKLNDSILSDPAFDSLDDSHGITLTPDGNEGRINPFAPLGSDFIAAPPTPTCVPPLVLNALTNTCAAPPPVCVSPKVLNASTNTCVNPPSISL